jgi:hypothetical protein
MRRKTSFAIVFASSLFATSFFGSQVSYGGDETLAARQREFAMCARCYPVSTMGTDAKKPLWGTVPRKSGGAIRYWSSAVTVTAYLTRDDVGLDKFVPGRADFVPARSMSISAPNGSDSLDLIAYPDTPEWGVQQHVAGPQGKDYRSRSLHRLSRGCGFHHSDIQHGLRC